MAPHAGHPGIPSTCACYKNFTVDHDAYMHVTGLMHAHELIYIEEILLLKMSCSILIPLLHDKHFKLMCENMHI